MMMLELNTLKRISRFNHPRMDSTIFHFGLIITLSFSLCLSFSPPSYGACPSDLNSDGCVDGQDIITVADQYGRMDCSAPGDCPADTDSDNDVDDDDLQQFATEFGLDSCLTPTIVNHPIHVDTTWTLAGSPYIVTTNITIQGTDGADGVTTLTIEPGVVVKLEPSRYMEIGLSSGDPGALWAAGTAENPITFTSNAATPAPGDWYSISFYNTTDDAKTILENCIVEYGGRGSASLYMGNAAFTIQNTTVRNSMSAGLYASGSETANARINCNTFTGNQRGIYWNASPPAEMHNNNFNANTGYGIYYTGAATLNAENNWWGDSAGPNQAGDQTFGNVDADPWSSAEIHCPASGLIFFDDFEYDVDRDATSVVSIFLAQGWSSAKTSQEASGAAGYIYTASSITDFAGTFPGVGSSRVLVLESLAGTLDRQTDFYLQYGDGDGEIGQIPPNHWFQFWVYVEETIAHPSRFSTAQSKLLYPNRASDYPATIDNEGYVYLAEALGNGGAPIKYSPCTPPDFPEFICDRAFISTRWNGTQGNIQSNIPDMDEYFGPNLFSEAHIIPNTWTLVKLHVDLTGTDPRAIPGHAVYEQWIRRQGETGWTKTTEYIGGVTEMNGSPVSLIPAYTDGFRTLRIPTTVGTDGERPDKRDYWVYLDDFALADTENALPAYD